MRNIVAVGAYERDNFGDYLFYEVLNRYLPNDRVIPTSVIAGDMEKEYGIVTIPYDHILNNYRIDAVWVVGGEVGGVDVPSALTMSLDVSRDIYVNSSGDGKRFAEKVFGANSLNHLAYIPNMNNYKLNFKSTIIVNSVGLSRVNVEDSEVMKTLTMPKAIGVRDSVSKHRLEDLGLRAKLSPDSVHTLPLVYKPSHIDNVGLLVQFNESYALNEGVASIAESLIGVADTNKLKISLIAAGLSYSHDSLEIYREVVNIVKESGIDVEIVDTRNPLEIVDYISSASATISTSLHFRIVSSAYGVPRVSLTNEKVSQYVEEWDSEFPYNVQLAELNQAFVALNDVEVRHLKKYSLTDEAHNNMREYIASIPDDISSDEVPVENQLIKELFFINANHSIAAVDDLLQSNQGLVSDLESIKIECEKIKLEREYYKGLYSDIVNSRSWKLISKLRKILRNN